MKNFTSHIILLFFCLNTSVNSFSQASNTFSRIMLNEEDKRLNLEDKIYLLHYFTILNYSEAKQALFTGTLPSGTFKFNLTKALDRSDRNHLKNDYSVDPRGATDYNYYESLPLTSIKKLAKDYYSELSKLEAIQKANTTQIDNAVSVSFAPKFFRVQGTLVSFEFSVFNMGLKDIQECYGHLSLTDSFGEVLIYGQVALEPGPFKSLSVLKFQELVDMTIWAPSHMSVTKEVDQPTLEKIEQIGIEKLLLKYEPTRIVFSDGTSLIR